MCKIPLVWNISLRRPHGGGPWEVQSVWSVFKSVMVSYIVRPLYEFHSQWNLQSNIENPVNTQKHGELFHASWNLKLYLVLRQVSVEHPPKKYVSYRVEGHKKQRAPSLIMDLQISHTSQFVSPQSASGASAVAARKSADKKAVPPMAPSIPIVSPRKTMLRNPAHKHRVGLTACCPPTCKIILSRPRSWQFSNRRTFPILWMDRMTRARSWRQQKISPLDRL